MSKKLTNEQIENYENDGFVSPVSVMSVQDALRFREQLEAAEARWPEAFKGVGRNNAHLNFTFLDEIVHHPGILDAVEDLIGPNILVSATVLFIKEPGEPQFVSWHQDATYMGLEPHSGVTAWLALSESNEEAGGMSMIPGSHKSPIQPHIDTYGEFNILTRGQEIPVVDELSAVPIVLKPGQMSLHHMRTVHGSRPNRSDDRRIGFSIQSYIQPDVRQTIGKTYVQVARGIDSHKNFPIAPRPSSNMEPEAIEFRRYVNELSSDILYRGAETRRDY